MSEMKNYAEMTFCNPILIDIFGKYMDNSLLASFVSDKGWIHFKFEVIPPSEPPKNCEDFLGLLFALLEGSVKTPVGKAYSAKKTEIMRETIFRLSQVLEGFRNVSLALHSTEKSNDDPNSEVSTHTEFTFNRTKSNSK